MNCQRAPRNQKVGAMSIRTLTALPVYNEAKHLPQVLPIVRRYATDVLVVDDGSRDATPELLSRERDIAVVRHPMNLGYGAAVNSAFEYALKHGFDVLVTIDCDGQHEPKLIPELAAAVFPEDGEPWDIVSGSRYLQNFANDNAAPPERHRINREITAQLNREFGLSLTDSFCGFKAYRVSSLASLHITEMGYAMPLQLWVQAVARKFRIREFAVPRVYLDENRTFGAALDDANRRMAYYQEVLRREMAAESGSLTVCDPCGFCGGM